MQDDGIYVILRYSIGPTHEAYLETVMKVTREICIEISIIYVMCVVFR